MIANIILIWVIAVMLVISFVTGASPHRPPAHPDA
jgi:hypothetical protein